MYLEIVASGECNREFFSVEMVDSSNTGLVEAVWKRVEDDPSFWIQVDGPKPGSYSQRPFLLGATLRQMGVNCDPRQGDMFNYKQFSSYAWEYYLTDGFMI